MYFLRVLAEPRVCCDQPSCCVVEIAADRYLIAATVVSTWSDVDPLVLGLNYLLEVAEDNARAVRLYLSSGFAQVATRANYYSRANSEPVDALLLSRSLP